MNTCPDVYVREIPSGVRPIAGVSTSETAFVDYFARGPVNKAVRVDSFGEFERRFGGLDAASEASYAIRQYFANGGAVAWVIRITAGTGDNSAKKSAIILDNALEVTAASDGAWGDHVHVGIAHPAVGPNTLFDLVVREYNGDNVVAEEVYRSLSTDAASSRHADKVVNANSSLVTVEVKGSARPGVSDGTKPIEDLAKDKLTKLEGGKDGHKPGSNEWKIGAVTALTGKEADFSGIYALKTIAPRIFNLLCIPAAASLSETNAKAVYASALKLCQDHRAFLLVDIAEDKTKLEDVTGWFTKMGAEPNAAGYFPRLEMPDPLNNFAPKNVAASGTVAGVYARIDAARGVWKAPAGTEAKLRGANIALQMTDKQNGDLNILGINALRIFSNHGNVVWGARTLAGADALASEWKYTPVRRIALFIEESLFQGLKWVVFEPNDEPLWAQIRMNVGAFMQILFRKGAFQGASAADAYFVKCDSETTTQADINLGIANILVGFAPLKPAEFVIIKIQQKANRAAA